MDRQKIVHVIQSLDNGGCENMLLRLLPMLKTFDHVIITLKRKGTLATKFERVGIPIYTINQKSLIDVPAYRRLLKLLRHEHPTIVMTYLAHADFIGRLVIAPITKTRVIPYLRTTYNYHHFRAARLFERATKFWANEYLANSPAVKDFYIRNLKVPAKKITVIPNGIQTQLYDRTNITSTLRGELGVTAADIVIICVANLYESKGHKYLLNACLHLSKYRIPFQVLIVGDGPQRANLEAMLITSSIKERIHFLGTRSDVPELLKISDIFVFPSLFEGMSNALLEAMAAGLACLTSDIPENRILINPPERGLTFQTGSIQDLADKLLELLQNPQKRQLLGTKAQAYVQKYYDLKIIAAQLTQYLI